MQLLKLAPSQNLRVNFVYFTLYFVYLVIKKPDPPKEEIKVEELEESSEQIDENNSEEDQSIPNSEQGEDEI